MYEANPITEKNGALTPRNVLNQPRKAVNQFQLPAAPVHLESLPLNRHPQWRNFIMDLHITILQQVPHLKETFRELLDRADQLG